MRKGIILAGGTGSRLFPLTYAVSKQLLPVYNKPMIYYGLSTLMLAGIKDFLIITRSEDQTLFKSLLGDGKQIGISISYAEQTSPRGIAEAFLIGQDFLDGNSVALVLGDNIFFGHELAHRLQSAKMAEKAVIFSYQVSTPEKYGVIETEDEKITQVLEKPIVNHFINAGIYLLNPAVFKLIPENDSYDMPELINRLINDGRTVISFPVREYWLDIGQHKDYMRAEEDVRKGKA